MKHECFARVRVYHQHGAHSLDGEVDWEINANSPASDLPNMEDRDRGLLVVGFHFGFYQMLAPAVSQLIPGCNPIQLRLRAARCADTIADFLERMIARRAADADRRSGASFLYVGATIPVLDLFCILRDGGCVAVAVDGMVAKEFIEVPFFDGVLRVPDGWARLAAITRSEVLLLGDLKIDGRRREFWLFDHVQCEENSDEAGRHAVAEAIGVLQRMMQMQPWAWHPWQRLQWRVDADGLRHYSLKQFGRGPKVLRAPPGATGANDVASGEVDGQFAQAPADSLTPSLTEVSTP